jgi:hypothetical protein
MEHNKNKQQWSCKDNRRTADETGPSARWSGDCIALPRWNTVPENAAGAAILLFFQNARW